MTTQSNHAARIAAFSEAERHMIADALAIINPDSEEADALAGALEAEFRLLMPQPPIRIVLNLSGGVMQGASIDRGAIELIAVDYDHDGYSDDDTVMQVPQVHDGTSGSAEASVCSLWSYETHPAFVAGVFDAVAKRDAARGEG